MLNNHHLPKACPWLICTDYNNLINALLAEGITPFITRKWTPSWRSRLMSTQYIIGTSHKRLKIDMEAGEIKQRSYPTLSDMLDYVSSLSVIESRTGKCDLPNAEDDSDRFSIQDYNQ
jgi:hypothetical protein